MTLIVPLLLFILRSRNFSSNSQHNRSSLRHRTDCCLYCEAETFQAIHNYDQLAFNERILLFILRSRNFSSNSQLKNIHNRYYPTVVYTAKQKLFKQFTTLLVCFVCTVILLFILRSRNFSSNSQHDIADGNVDDTVVYTAKQKLFKQFTTWLGGTSGNIVLLFILRSRNFSSNSQRSLLCEL